MAVRKKQFPKVAHHQSLVPASEAAQVPQWLVDELTEDFGRPVEWTADYVDDLRAGDVVLVRSMQEVPGEDNLGNPIKLMTVVEGGKMMNRRNEEVFVAMVDRVYEKGPKKTLMIRMDQIWSATKEKTTRTRRWGTTLGQDKIVAETKLPADQRRREVLRLVGSGPEPEERQTQNAIDHSLENRFGEFKSLFDLDEDRARYYLLGAFRYADPEDGRDSYPGSAGTTSEMVDEWRDGVTEAPDWAFDVMADNFHIPHTIERRTPEPQEPIVPPHLMPTASDRLGALLRGDPPPGPKVVSRGDTPVAAE